MKNLRIVLAMLALLVGAVRSNAQSYVVVVNSANPVTTVSKGMLNDLFLKRAVRFYDGEKAAPVNLERTSPTRDAFSRAVHGKGAATVEAYWQGQIFAGKETPPPTRATDAEVLAFVREKPSAIGYVSAGTALGANVKIVKVN